MGLPNNAPDGAVVRDPVTKGVYVRRNGRWMAAPLGTQEQPLPDPGQSVPVTNAVAPENQAAPSLVPAAPVPTSQPPPQLPPLNSSESQAQPSRPALTVKTEVPPAPSPNDPPLEIIDPYS